MMYRAKLIKLSKEIEEEVILKINSKELLGFAYYMPYAVGEGVFYNVALTLTILDHIKIAEQDDGEDKKGIEYTGEGFECVLFGMVYDGKIDIGSGIKIEDDLFNKYSYLNGKHIKITIDRLGVEFL